MKASKKVQDLVAKHGGEIVPMIREGNYVRQIKENEGADFYACKVCTGAAGGHLFYSYLY